jgi:hypothetical protein
LIIDDDVKLRNSLERLLRSVGLDAQLFASISDFLASAPPDGSTCLVLDVRFPGRSGLYRKSHMPQAFPTKAIWRVISVIWSVLRIESFDGRNASNKRSREFPGAARFRHGEMHRRSLPNLNATRR